MWMSIDVREWYRAMKLKIATHAFASPFEMIGMLMAINAGKEAKYRIRLGSTGKKIAYATLNIMLQSANEQIASQVNVNEIDDEGGCWRFTRAGWRCPHSLISEEMDLKLNSRRMLW